MYSLNISGGSHTMRLIDQAARIRLAKLGMKQLAKVNVLSNSIRFNTVL